MPKSRTCSSSTATSSTRPPEDFELAKTILDEEWDESIPYIYVPGNHEIMGGEIGNFEHAFGSPTGERTVGRTKIVTLNSSDGTLNGSDDSQLNMLEDALDEVAESDELTGITVFFHHPRRIRCRRRQASSGTDGRPRNSRRSSESSARTAGNPRPWSTAT